MLSSNQSCENTHRNQSLVENNAQIDLIRVAQPKNAQIGADTRRLKSRKNPKYAHYTLANTKPTPTGACFVTWHSQTAVIKELHFSGKREVKFSH